MDENMDIKVYCLTKWEVNPRTLEYPACDIEEAYVNAGYVVSMTTEHAPFLSNKKFNKNYLSMIMEELIHACLPDPEALFRTNEDDFDDGLWKHYFLDLLLK